MPATIELRSNPSSPSQYEHDQVEMGNLPKTGSGSGSGSGHEHEHELQKVESTSTWPSITKSSIGILPKYNHIFTLFAALLLSTALALFSALDAAIHCTRGTNVWSLPWFGSASGADSYSYTYYDYNRKLEDGANNYYNDDYHKNNDDDNGNANSGFSEAQNCKYLFTSAMMPVCLAVVILCFVSCRWTLHSQEWKRVTTSASTSTSAPNIPQSKSYAGQVQDGHGHDRDLRRFKEFQDHVSHQVQHLKSCYELFFISVLCTGLWMYATVMIAHDSDFPLVDEDGENNLFTLQFQSLGAINYIGEVGQNANLYYSSWFSLLVSIALVYELGRITHKHYLVTQDLKFELARISRHRMTQTNAVETIITWSKSQQQLIKDNRSAWHESLYKLRFRTGVWLTTLIASAILYQSSQRVWENSIYPVAEANGEVGDDGIACTIIHGYFSSDSLDDLGFMHPSKCERTRAARATGLFCTGLSILALFAHYRLHTQVAQEIKSSSKLLQNRTAFPQILEKRRKVIPLRFECLFACIISVVLAINALFATAVEGPASNVGNLYYSSWIAFISSMRLALNCLEDMMEQDEAERSEDNHIDEWWSDDLNYQPNQAVDNKIRRSSMTRRFSMNTNFQIKEEVSTRLVMLAPTVSTEEGENGGTEGSYIGGMPIPKQNSLHQMFEERIVEEEEASRAKRARRWASGCIFSTIYLMSALDAVSQLSFAILISLKIHTLLSDFNNPTSLMQAFNESFGELDIVQLYMVICPCIVASLCLLMFFLCLNSKTYQIVDQFKVGGAISLFLLFIWVWNLIFTLHHESSWAVNEIGDVEMANLYYFTWLTVLNAGILMSSYVKKLFNSKGKPLMVVLWLAVVKICFVMFGSCCDILLSVRSQCEASVHGDATATFCERTVAGAVLGFVGMAAGFCAAMFRYVHPSPALNGLKLEAAMAAILTVLFSISLALITGIGGPGQSVGDLYYGSWLAFLASLGVASSLYSEIMNQERDLVSPASDSSEEDTIQGMAGAASTPYVSWEVVPAGSKNHMYT